MRLSTKPAEAGSKPCLGNPEPPAEAGGKQRHKRLEPTAYRHEFDRATSTLYPCIRPAHIQNRSTRFIFLAHHGPFKGTSAGRSRFRRHRPFLQPLLPPPSFRTRT